MNTAVNAPERIKVFWQPGCTSCLRTKEFLTKQGVDFESINVHNNPEGMAQLLELGVRSVPVVSVGKRYTFCQTFEDVIKFLELKVNLNEALPPAELVARINIVLDALSQMVVQFDDVQLHETFRDRNRTAGNTAFHAVRVIEVGIGAAQGSILKQEYFGEKAPPEWTAQDIVNRAEQARELVNNWWTEQQKKDPTVDFLAPTYYGNKPMHDVLERTTWHAAQHARQVALMLESHGITPARALTEKDLQGLPVPEEAWG